MKNRPSSNVDYLGLACTPLDPPYIPDGNAWELFSTDLDATKGSAMAYMLNGFTATWKIKGRVKCCCKGWFGSKETKFKDVFKTFSSDQSIDGIVIYSPANTGPSSPDFKTIGEALGKILGQLLSSGMEDILGYYIPGADAKWLSGQVLDTKPGNTDAGEWPTNPCD